MIGAGATAPSWQPSHPAAAYSPRGLLSPVSPKLTDSPHSIKVDGGQATLEQIRSQPVNAVQDISIWMRKPRVLFLAHISAPCTHIAEGYLRQSSEKQLDISSAALRLRPVYPLAIEVMDEDGIDIRAIRPQSVTSEVVEWADRIIVLTTEPEPLLELIPKDRAVPTTWLIEQPTPEDRVSYLTIRNEIKRRVSGFANAVGLAHR